MVNKIITLNESFSDTIESFQTWATRKLKGYSVGEIDHLANKVKSIDSEVEKRAALERIEDALKAARTTLSKATNESKRRELRLQIEVLTQLKSKANSFSVIDGKDAPKDDGDRREVIDLDEK